MGVHHPTVLLTGPTGMVGSPLIERVPAESLICLAHRSTVKAPAVRVVHGDLRQPRLGLSRRDYEDLSDRVDVVVNSAAVTRFGIPSEEVFAVNVRGVEHLLGFVADSNARLIALSTAFVDISEEDSGWLSPKAYLESKRRAEALIRESGLDNHIVRPSLVIGDSQTGEAAHLQGYHFVFRALLRDKIPLIPVDPCAIADFVPADVLADVLAAMIVDAPPWRVSWVTAGKDAWLAQRLVDAALEFADARGSSVNRPRLVAPEMVERLIRPVFFPSMPKRLVTRYDQLASVSAVVFSPHRFETSLHDLEHHYGREFNLKLEQTLERSLEFLLASIRPSMRA